MPNGFGRVPVQAKVTAGDREVSGDGEFLTGTQSEESAIVADAETQAASRVFFSSGTDSLDKSELAATAGTRRR